MNGDVLLGIALVGALLLVWYRTFRRLQLSRAKHPSLRGHSRLARAAADLVPSYEYSDHEVFRCGGTDDDVVHRHEAGFVILRGRLATKAPDFRKLTGELEPPACDMKFTNAYRVPCQFRRFVRRNLRLGAFATATSGVKIGDVIGAWKSVTTGLFSGITGCAFVAGAARIFATIIGPRAKEQQWRIRPNA